MWTEPFCYSGGITPAGVNPGTIRAFVACSNAYASRSNFASLHAVPMKLNPTGIP